MMTEDSGSGPVPQAALAARAAEAAYVARYGPTSTHVRDQLMHLNRTLYT